MEIHSQGLVLTEDEAFALLTLALSSGMKLDPTAVQAVDRLAEYCRTYCRDIPGVSAEQTARELLIQAG